jgi:hypothetical protein
MILRQPDRGGCPGNVWFWGAGIIAALTRALASSVAAPLKTGQRPIRSIAGNTILSDAQVIDLL